MKLIDADLINEGEDFQLNVTAYSPTLGWKDISISAPVYVMPPSDGIQDIIISGTPPDGVGLTSIMTYPLSIPIISSDWLQGLRIQNNFGEILTTLRTPVKNRNPVGDDWIVIQNSGLKGDKLLLDVKYDFINFLFIQSGIPVAISLAIHSERFNYKNAEISGMVIVTSLGSFPVLYLLYLFSRYYSVVPILSNLNRIYFSLL